MATVELQLGEWNVGAGSHASVTKKVKSLLLEEGCSGVALIETGDRQPVKDALVAAGFDYVEGTSPGAKQVGVVTSPSRLKRTSDPFEVQVGERTPVGEAGAGGDTMHAKYVVGAEYEDLLTHRKFTLAAKHVVPSVKIPARRELARIDLQLTSAWVTATPGQIVLMGDMNMRAEHPLMQPLHDTGMVCDQVLFEELGTHGVEGEMRPIDQIWWQPMPAWVAKGHRVVNLSAEDHDAMIMTWQVRVRVLTDPMDRPATPSQILIATNNSIFNADIAAAAARDVHLPFYVACALLEKESHGRNVWGNDKRYAEDGKTVVEWGVFSGLKDEVTEATFKAFLHEVVTHGKLSNGVGPCQITYAGSVQADGTRTGGYFSMMEAENLKPWDVRDNMAFGFDLLLDHYNNSKDKTWLAAGTAYNGKSEYGRDLDAKVKAWKARLAR